MSVTDSHTERYELIDRIAIGGMAEVYRAKSFGAHGFEKTLAIKRILPELAAQPEFEHRFISEAKLAVDMAHANIVQVLDFGRFAGSLFIAMEYVDGLDLAALLKFHTARAVPVPLPAAFQIAIEICRGLDFAHKHDVIHRDVSPSNILLSRAGEVKVADFGIAQAATAHVSQKKVMGKWRYMSPEQARAEPLSIQSDLFSLGAMLYELFTGKKLFPGDEPEEIAANIESMPIPRPSESRAELPERVDQLIATALERKPSDRPESAALMQRQLTEICYESAILATPLDVAELVTGVVGEPAAVRKRSSRVSGIDALIRAQLAGAGASDATRRTAVDGATDETTGSREGGGQTGRGESRPTPTSIAAAAAPAIVSRGTGSDGITVWEIDRETIAAVPSAIRGGKPTGSMQAVPEPGTPTGSKTSSRWRRLAIGGGVAIAVAAAAMAVVAWLEGAGITAADAGALARGPADATPVSAELRTRLRIDSVPAGATVFLDGRRLDQVSPVTVAVEPGARNRVRLELSGYEPWEDATIQVRRGETFGIRPTLESRVASLFVVSHPEGAEVLIDHRVVGTTPFERRDLPPGRITVELRKDGFKPVVASAQLQSSEPVRIERSLQEATVFGTIDLQIDDGWADVYLDGKKIGRAPARGLRVPIGVHRLRLYNPPSKRERFLEVDVVEGETRYYRTRL